MLITGAVPAALAIAVANIVAIDDHTVQVELASERAEVACPACGTMATRVHSRYQRLLADLLAAHLRRTLSRARRAAWSAQ